MSGVRPKPTSSSQNQSRSNHGLGSVGGSSASEAYMQRLQQSAMSGTLQYMEPEELAPADEDLELELIDYEDSGSEFTSGDEDGAGNDEQSEYDTISNMNTGRTSEIFAIAEPLTDRSNKPDYVKMMEQEEEENMLSRPITFTGTLVSEGDIEVDSEEENDIMKEIKAEVFSHVRKEMGTELDVYRAKKEMSGKEAEAQKHGDLQGLEPKIKDAILKMRKLDKILEKKIKREKEVKRDRILLQRRLKVELEEIKNDGHKESKEAQTNTSKFLALTLPPSHNKGVNVDDDHPSPPVTPVFQTQVLESDLKAGTANKGKHSSAAGSSVPESEAGRSSCSSSMSGFTDTTDITAGGTHKKAKRKKKDFIKRNKQLAADASNAIAMTDDEKNRVEGLLGDLDTLPELPEETEAVEMAQENPYQITLSMGDGFLPTQDEMARLNKIDDRLRALLPPEDYASVASVSWNITPQQKVQFAHSGGVRSSSDLFSERFGERVLRDHTEQRSLQERLADIENELKMLTSAVDIEIESPSLSEYQLQNLLDDCARTMSRATEETSTMNSARSNTESHVSVYSNPPRLPDEVLQQLLIEARSGVGSSSMLSYRTAGSSLDLGDGEVMPLEPISEESIQELLRDHRTTSRAMSRAMSQASSAASRPQSAVSQATEMQDDALSRCTNTTPQSPAKHPHSRPTSTSQSQMQRSGSVESSSSTYSDSHWSPQHHPTSKDVVQKALRQSCYDLQSEVISSARNASSASNASYEKPEPFLPEIDPRGSMSTQRLGGLNVLSRPSSSGGNNDIGLELRSASGSRLNNDTPASSRLSTSGRSSAITIRNNFAGSPEHRRQSPQSESEESEEEIIVRPPVQPKKQFYRRPKPSSGGLSPPLF